MLSLFAIEASSQMIKAVCFNNVARALYFGILQVTELLFSSGILNLECAVLPLGMFEAAIPDVAVGRTIFPINRIFA